MNQNTGYAEIDIRELFSLLIKKSWIIVICIVIAAGISGYYSYTKLTDYYRAEATIYLGKEDQIGTIDLGTISLNNQLMSDYLSLINSRLVADEVVKRLRLSMSGEAMQYAVSAYSTSSQSKIPTRMFRLSYISTDPKLAADIVNTTSEVVLEKAKDIFGVNNAQIVDNALVPRFPIGPDRKKNVMIAAAVGFVLGIIIIFIVEVLDHTFKKPEEVERLVGLTVLGTIPLFKGEKRNEPKKKG